MKLGEGRAVLFAGLLIHAIFLASLSGNFLDPLFVEAENSPGQACDYFGIWQAGDNLIHGSSIYDSEEYRDEAERSVPYFYFYRYLPPTAYVSALSSLVFPPWVGYWNWVIFNELLLLLLVVWILRLNAYPIRLRRMHAALWLGFFPFYLEQWMGQFSFLMAAFVWVMMRDSMPDRPEPEREEVPAGRSLRAWIASVGLKSYTALFALTYLRRRRIRPVIICAAAVILVSAPYYIARPDDLRQFLHLNMGMLPPKVHGGTLGASALVRMLGWSLPENIAGFNLDFRVFDVRVGNVPVLSMIALIALTALWFTLKRGVKAPQLLQIGFWMLAFFLIFKDVWEYHYVMLLPVVTAIGLAYGSRLMLWMGLLLALPTPYALFVRDGSLSFGADLLQHSVKAIPTAVMFIWVLKKGLSRWATSDDWATTPLNQEGGRP